MIRRTSFLAAASSLMICATAMAGSPTIAAAQSAPASPRQDEAYAYDTCHRDRVERGTGGALLGAGLGALAGSNIASRGARTEGAVLGGLLGAVIGGNVGASSAACVEGDYGPPIANEGPYDDTAEDQAEAPPPSDEGYAGAPPPGYGDSVETTETCRVKKRRVVQANGVVRKEYVQVCKSGQGGY
ncbi:MAG: glycine zipper 2TM domain-containing protein [Caulobacter sp.]|nr:glycine zipper 2TM domain-containing protein [Caulobacter sp.]